MTTRAISSIGLRSPSNMVPRRSLNVCLQTLQRERRLCFSGIVRVPAPVLPLAMHLSFGHHCFDGSIGSVSVCILDSLPVDACFFEIP